VRAPGMLLSATWMATAVFASAVSAQTTRPSLSDSFRLGSGGGVLCQVQTSRRDEKISTIFDRSWAVVCRDAARPIGKLYQLRGTLEEISTRLAAARINDATCTAGGSSEPVEDLGPVAAQLCMLNGASVGYKVLTLRRGNTVWVAEGLSAYDSALKLALRTIIADKTVPGQVSVATTSVDDPVAFARVQAGTLDPELALAEGYRRNNSGNYAEAAEFFDTLQQRTDNPQSTDSERQGEYLVNRALQKSNLGEFGEADALFAEARKVPTVDRVQTRLRRNFEAMHLLNQQRYAEALVRIDQPVAPIVRPVRLPNSAIEIGSQVAAEINSGIPVGQRLGATEASALTPEERSVFLDAQALQLRGTLLRLSGKPAEGRAALEKAYNDVIEVRDGRVISVIRLRSQILAETGLALEQENDVAGAEAKMRESLALLQTRYPQTIAVNGARARLASLLARHGKTAEAMIEYREVVRNAASASSSTTGLGNLLSPYFGLLSDQMAANPALVDDMFLASQTLVRPGVADTQAILARELSEGTGESASLFRQSRTLARDIERSRIDLANLDAAPNKTGDVEAAILAVKRDLEALERDQTTAQAKLAAFPKYRAISTTAITLADLRQTLKPGEAYFKLSVIGRSVFALYADEAGATGYRVALSAAELDAAVDRLRDTISKNEGGQLNTYPFDVKLAHQLFDKLLGPVAARVGGVKHLIFEPDGAMLRLPVNLLVMSQPGIDAYEARIREADADEFDFRGIEWLGRKRAISTAVSARAFRDARNSPASSAMRQYLGFGQNAPVSSAIRVASTRSLAGGVNCMWPTSEWNKPISAAELQQAQAIVGADRSTIITGRDFSDTAVIARPDLADYRILHFATHGLVTAPRPECPARPALLTSFGDGDSDGLLSFREIYDLKLNADLVILSACDTAGKATIAATREAGVTTGGGSALDGLVRAFIGAGGRSVLASHWPAPDDFKATERLISGIFRSEGSISVGEALEKAQQALMDEPATSHPYYWSGFAIIGDGAQQLLSARP
jgi:CHAT domain-containing protein